MNKIKISLQVVLIALICCFVGLTAGRPDQVSAAKKKATPTPVVQDQAVKAAKAALAKHLGISTGEISLIEVTRMTWPDSCLGLSGDGEMCAQMLVEGFRIVLRARETNYVLRTNTKGTMVRIET